MNNENEFKFGDYAIIEQKRHGVPNEMFVHKVIGQLRSNTWVDVPVQSPATETLHDEMEDVCWCICCGVDENEVRAYRVKDMQRSSLSPDGGEVTALALTLEKSRESSGCPAGVDQQEWLKQLAAERDAALNAERVWETAMMEVCGEDGPASVASEIRSLQALRDTAMQALKSQVGQLASENKRLTDIAQGGAFVMQKALMKYEFGVGMTMQAENFIRDSREKHPATDRIVAGIKADGATAAGDYLKLNAQHMSDDERLRMQDAAEICYGTAARLREGADK